jgi:hemerythrin
MVYWQDLQYKNRRKVMYRFTQDCRVGIDEIDDEHEKLFGLINQTMEMVKTGNYPSVTAKKLLSQLKDYAMTHFAHEEAYMEKIHDKELKRQKKEHAVFKEKVDSYDLDEISEEDGAKVLEELLDFMVQWLYRHIIGSDIMIGKFTEAAPEDAFSFTDAYRTGIGFVDEEHKKLFEIIRETNDLIQDEMLHDKYDQIVHIIGKLKDYTKLHFTDEERYMGSIGYDGLNMQRIAHTAFIDRLNEIDLNDMDDNQKEYLDDLIEFLLEWLINHIMKMDKKIPKK